MTEDGPTDPVSDQVLDGNALAGTLAATFGTEMTTVRGQCAHCGAVSMVGQLRAYVRAPGAVLRCPACDGIVLRVVETAEATYVDARGAAHLRFVRR
jgi:Zn finger protein HypA/HybF involved in hydrogenase expression